MTIAGLLFLLFLALLGAGGAGGAVVLTWRDGYGARSHESRRGPSGRH